MTRKCKYTRALADTRSYSCCLLMDLFVNALLGIMESRLYMGRRTLIRILLL